jgi:hypothetical protein
MSAFVRLPFRFDDPCRGFQWQSRAHYHHIFRFIARN